MATGNTISLSLLSRGVGEIQRTGQEEKVQVYFEPEDYNNWVDTSKSYYFPSLHAKVADQHSTVEASVLSRAPHDSHEINLPKTFSTRRGALFLFSEDLAQKHRERHSIKHIRNVLYSRQAKPLDLRTVEDLANSVLAYRSTASDNASFKLIPGTSNEKFERQFRPGFSAKRYLATWSKFWDASLLEKLLKKGYIQEKSLFCYSPLLSKLQHRLYNDLSLRPAPYRLMRNMLLSTGNIFGYTFYKEKIYCHNASVEEHRTGGHRYPSENTMIKILKYEKGFSREISYENLEKKEQEEVLTDLLIQSTVHKAIKNHQDFLEESLSAASECKESASSSFLNNRKFSNSSISSGKLYGESMPDFNMKEAVQSLLDAGSSHSAISLSVLPGRHIDKLHSSCPALGTVKGKALRPYVAKSINPAYCSNWCREVSEKEYVHKIPGACLQEPDSQYSSIPNLPPIGSQSGPLASRGLTRTQSKTNEKLPLLKPKGSLIIKEDLDFPICKTRTNSCYLINEDKYSHTLPSLNVVPATSQHSAVASQPLPKLKGVFHDLEDSFENEGKEKEDWIKAVGDRQLQNSTSDAKKKRDEVIDRTKRCPGVEKILHKPLGTFILPHIDFKSGIRMPVYPRVSFGPPCRWNGGFHNTRKGENKVPQQMKGSIIYAPGGEIVHVGGALFTSREAENRIKRVTGKRKDDQDSVTVPASYNNPLKASHTHCQDSSDGAKPTKTSTDMTESFISKAAVDENKMEFPPSGFLHVCSVSLAKKESPSMSGQEIVRVLAEQAQNVAKVALSQQESGKDLQSDVELITDQISRAVSGKSSKLTEEECRGLILEKVGEQSGHNPDAMKVIRDGIELQALSLLVTRSLATENDRILEEKQVERNLYSKAEITEILGGVKEGHIYLPVSSNEYSEKSLRPTQSIPSRRSSSADIGQVDVINYGHSLNGFKHDVPTEQEDTPVNLLTATDFKEGKTCHSSSSGKSLLDSNRQYDTSNLGDLPSDVQSLIKNREKPDKLQRKRSESLTGTVSALSKVSVSGKTVKSHITNHAEEFGSEDENTEQKESKLEVKSGLESTSKPKNRPKSYLFDREDFKVGKVDYLGELGLLYGGPAEQISQHSMKGETKEKRLAKGAKKGTRKKGKGKKGKASKKKKVERDSQKPIAENAEDAEEEEQEESEAKVAKEMTDIDEPEEDLLLSSSPKSHQSEEEVESIVTRDQSSPEIAAHMKNKSVVSAILSPSPVEVDAAQDDELETMESISNKAVRAAQRKARAAKRREDVERKRREREDQIRKEREEAERQERLKQEMEEERRKREEERRQRKLMEEEERNKLEAEEREYERRKRLEFERERRMREERARKLAEMKQQQVEEEKRRQELLAKKLQEEEERRRMEEQLLEQMAEQERIEYERKKREEEKRRHQEEAAAKKRREEESRRAMEEARRLAEEMARKQIELEARLQFNQTLRLEAAGLNHSQDITRAFVFSYFELLQWLGVEMSEEELQNFNSHV